jgi:Kef-type K+ transport system membrane component KefB
MVVLFDDPRTVPLATFLVQVFITLVVCKVLAKLLAYIRQPQVIGQIIAGIIFGPSVLGTYTKQDCFSFVYKKYFFV